jgi:flagellin
MIINHNIPAMDTHRNLMINDFAQNKSLEKLSSGMRINRSRDDAAGLSVSEKMRSQVRGLTMANRNAQDGISLIQTAEGWLQETTDLIQRIRELTVQAANGVYTDVDRSYIGVEVKQLVNEIDRIASQSQFNTLRMLRGAMRQEDPAKPLGSFPSDGLYEPESGGGITLHIGANMDERVKFYIDNMGSAALGLGEDGQTSMRELAISVSTVEKANQSLATLDEALYKVSEQRSILGAMQNRLEHSIKGTNIAINNLQSAESLIRDTDMAFEMVNFTKANILTQSAMSMLAQAQAKPQLVLRVLG